MRTTGFIDKTFAVMFAVIGITGLIAAVFYGATQHYFTAVTGLLMAAVIRRAIKDDEEKNNALQGQKTPDK